MENDITNLFQIPFKWDEIQNFELDHFESSRYNLNLEYWSLFLLSWTLNWGSSIRGLARIKPSLDSPVLVCLKMVLSSHSRMMQCHPSSYTWPSSMNTENYIHCHHGFTRSEMNLNHLPLRACCLLSDLTEHDATRRGTNTSWSQHGHRRSDKRVSAVLGRLGRVHRIRQSDSDGLQIVSSLFFCFWTALTDSTCSLFRSFVEF